MTPARDDARHVALVLDAFLQEHRRCGELDGGVYDTVMWMTCNCGALIVRSANLPTTPR